MTFWCAGAPRGSVFNPSDLVSGLEAFAHRLLHFFFFLSLSCQSGVQHHGMAHRCVREHVQQRCDAVSGDALGVTDRLDRQVLTRTPMFWLHPRAHDLCVWVVMRASVSMACVRMCDMRTRV